MAMNIIQANDGYGPYCEIELSSGYTAKVSPEDYAYLNQWKWHYANQYAIRHERIDVNKRIDIRMHRVVMELKGEGESIIGIGVDHRNHDPIDNRRSNLRPACQTLNNQNRGVIRNQFGFKGVVQESSGGYSARITIDKKKTFLGTYPTKEIAGQVYAAAAIKYFGEFAFPGFEYNGPTLEEWQERYKKMQPASEYVGVTKNSSGNWVATLYQTERSVSAGTYKEEVNAAIAVDLLRIETVGYSEAFEKLNFPDKDYTGISFEDHRKAFTRQTEYDYKGISAGCGGYFGRVSAGNLRLKTEVYMTQLEAAIAVDELRLYIHGRTNSQLMNFPDDNYTNLRYEGMSIEEIEELSQLSRDYYKYRLNEKRKSAKSIYLGVTPSKRGKWAARFTYKGEKYQYENKFSEVEAAIAADKMRLKICGKDAITRLNFPLSNYMELVKELNLERYLSLNFA